MIADLHCDLLYYLEGNDSRTPYDLKARMAIPQMEKGGVRFQVLPIFAETLAGSQSSGEKQMLIFNSLCKEYGGKYSVPTSLKALPSDKISILPSIENGSALIGENEPLDRLFERIETIEAQLGKLVYISLTWNQENRLGGGAHAEAGLKPDGEKLLEFLNGKKIAVDFSHTSDSLAYGILNYLDKKGLRIPVMASHSNMREITDVKRNLPDEIAKEILQRDGVIGINFVKEFIGETPLYFLDHLHHALSLGAESQLCFGADFFYEDDLSEKECFFPEFGNSGTYSDLLAMWKEHLGLSSSTIERICYKNLFNYLDNFIL